MKKLVALIVLLVFVLGLSACDTKEEFIYEDGTICILTDADVYDCTLYMTTEQVYEEFDDWEDELQQEFDFVQGEFEADE